MDPEVVGYLRSIGNFSAPLYIFLSVASSVLYGITFPIFILSVYMDWRRGSWTALATTYSCAKIVCFFLVTLILSAYLTESTSILGILVDTVTNSYGNPTSMEETMNRKLFLPDILCVWSENLLIGISDAIVIWRASVIFPNPWMVRFLLVLWAASIGSVATMNVILSSYKNWVNTSLELTRLNEASNWLSLATNVVTVLYITHGIWEHQRSVGILDHECQVKSPIRRALETLLVTGSAFCMLQGTASVLQQLLDKGTIPYTLASNLGIGILFGVMYTFAGIYPAVVNVLVQG